MQKKIVAFGASNSSRSINKRFATYAANQLENVDVNILDLNDYEMPIFSIDREENTGIPALAKAFKTEIKNADGIIISFAEHNGAYTAAFKNIMDWISRIEKETWANKPVLLLSTSPGGRGGKTVLGIATTSFPYRASKVTGSFSLPFFNKNFSDEDGILDENLQSEFEKALQSFATAI